MIHRETMNRKTDRLIASLAGLAKNQADAQRISALMVALDQRYDLFAKIAREPGVEPIIEQLMGRLIHAFGSLSVLVGKRILDIACGSSTSKAPSSVYVNTPFGEHKIKISNTEEFTAQFEPWFCRIVLELGAAPVGIDIGDLHSEPFEHHIVDLGVAGALDFLPDGSFDAVHDSRLFGSPEFTAQFSDRADRLRVAREIAQQERRLLKAGGIVIHSDAVALVGRSG
jgi:hypothetical protein